MIQFVINSQTEGGVEKKKYINTFFRPWQKIMTEQASQKEN